MPESTTHFKINTRQYLIQKFNKESIILDVGPGRGLYYDLLIDKFPNIDCCEVFKPYIEQFNLMSKYRNVFNENILDFEFDWYDVIIMGDILEHIDIENAQKLIDRLYDKCKQLIVAVPWTFKQGIVYNNEHEIHKQEDLTPEIMQERYSKLQLIWKSKICGIYFKKEQ